MIEFSKIKKNEKVADLGSGNGRVVIEFAKLPNVKEVHGFEINPFLEGTQKTSAGACSPTLGGCRAGGYCCWAE